MDSGIPVFDDVVSNTITSISTTVISGNPFPSLNMLMLFNICSISPSCVADL